MAPPAHLALFIRTLGGGGGAERTMTTLAGEFAARGHRVDLLLGRASGRFLADVPPSVRVVDLGGGSWRRSLGWLARDREAARALAPGLLGWPPQWVLACAPPLADYLGREKPAALLSALNYTNLAALWARGHSGASTRLVVSERNTLSVRARRGSGSFRALPRLVRHFYPRADAIAAVSEGVAADLARVLGTPRPPIRVTWNPVVTPELARLAAEPPGHPWLRPGEPPLVLGAGKLRAQKGFALLLDAFARLRRRRPLRLAILGDGPLRGRLLRRARSLGVAEDVALPGFQPNPFAWMAHSRVFALSSAWEGLPGVLIQAMACGCPVVATDCPSGPAEILEGGRLGALVPPGDAVALADAIGAALDAPPPAQALRERASAFSLARSSDLYLDLLLGS